MALTFTPHSYQQEALAHLYKVRRGALWMPMGGGKTVTTLTALEHLNVVEDVYPALILAPLRVARSTWPEEVRKWRHLKHIKVSVITGTPKQRERALAAEADVYCTNYDNLVWLRKELGDAWPFKTVVADELTRLKSFRLRQGSKRARALGKRAHRSERFIGLTGTPSSNGLKDLWGQTWFLDRGSRLGATFAAFEERWFRKGWDGYSLEPMPNAQDEIQDRLRDICLTVRGLPVDEPIINDIYVDLPPAARALYDEMEDEMFALIEGEGVEAANAAVRTSKLQQIANGAPYLNEAHDWAQVHDEKLQALDSVMEEAAGAPVLLAYTFQADLQRVLKRYPKARHLDADPKTIDDWNAGKIPLLAAHPRSAGHGLNLQDGGNILVYFGVDWDLELHMQILERIGPLRQAQSGHDRPVFVHRILARGTVDDMILDRLQSKRSVQDILLEALKRRRRD
jgi:SNF2 family DNA or RNA helicase